MRYARIDTQSSEQSTTSLLQQVCATVQAAEPRSRIACTITPQHRTMRYRQEWISVQDMAPGHRDVHRAGAALERS